MNKKKIANRIRTTLLVVVAAGLLFTVAVPAKAGVGDISMKVGEQKTFQWKNAAYENIESADWYSTNSAVASIVSRSGQTATVQGVGVGTCVISCRVTSYHEVWDIIKKRYVIQDRLTESFSWTVAVTTAAAPATQPQQPSGAAPQNSPSAAPSQPSDTPKTKVKSLKLNKKTLKMKRGTKKTLRCTVRPAAAKGSVKWKSSNKRVATVSQNGRVTAKRVGTAKITAYASGIKKTCKVTVRR